MIKTTDDLLHDSLTLRSAGDWQTLWWGPHPNLPTESRREALSDPALIIRAGSHARRVLAETGFDRDTFSTLVGASGGPKWLILARMDEVLARRFVSDRKTPLAMVGSSIGSFRHAALAQRDPSAAMLRFEESYLEQAYEEPPTGAEVTQQSLRILRDILGSTGSAELIDNPLISTHIIAVRSRAATASEQRALLAIGLGAAATANALSRDLLGNFFQRVVFHSAGERAAIGFDGFDTLEVALSEANLVDALAASGSVPLVMAAIHDPAGAPSGVYRDGGITDYHFDFAFRRPPGLVLYPHFFDRITPGWFDKNLPWRRPDPQNLSDTVFIAPSPSFVASLPGGHVPDRGDFMAFPTAERMQRWSQAMAETNRLADELESLMDGPIDPAQIQAFP